jgi:hypothetical protein
VVFNNRHWRPGDFTDFQAEAFYFLEGAVDVESLAPDPQRYYQSHSAPFVVGGLANKNVKPLIEAARICGEGVDDGRLRLSGVPSECELPKFYANLDCVAATR